MCIPQKGDGPPAGDPLHVEPLSDAPQHVGPLCPLFASQPDDPSNIDHEVQVSPDTHECTVPAGSYF